MRCSSGGTGDDEAAHQDGHQGAQAGGHARRLGWKQREHHHRGTPGQQKEAFVGDQGRFDARELVIYMFVCLCGIRCKLK